MPEELEDTGVGIHMLGNELKISNMVQSQPQTGCLYFLSSQQLDKHNNQFSPNLTIQLLICRQEKHEGVLFS